MARRSDKTATGRSPQPPQEGEQLTLERVYTGRGGARPGAGRPPGKGRRPTPHRVRAAVCRDRPLLVTLRLAQGLPQLRRARAFEVVQRAIAAGHREGFVIVQFSVMNNHVHFIAEADDNNQLTRGLQRLKIRMARQLNGLWRRSGTVFEERYSAQDLTTPTRMRDALTYVLCNARKHAAQGGRAMPRGWVDPFSSARQFDGWRQKVRREDGVVAPARSWLLRKGWRKRGLLDTHAIPPKGPP